MCEGIFASGTDEERDKFEAHVSDHFRTDGGGSGGSNDERSGAKQPLGTTGKSREDAFFPPPHPRSIPTTVAEQVWTLKN